MSQRFTGGGIGSDLPEAFPPAHDDAWAEILEDTTGRHDRDIPEREEHRVAISSAQVPNSKAKKPSSSESPNGRRASSEPRSQAPIVPPGIRPRFPTRSQSVISEKSRDDMKSGSGPVMPSLIKPVFADEESADVALKVPLHWEKSGPRRTPSGSFATANSENPFEARPGASSGINLAANPGADGFQTSGSAVETRQSATDGVDPRSKPVYSQIETAFEDELADYPLPLNVRLSRFTERTWEQIKGIAMQGLKRRELTMGVDSPRRTERASIGAYKAQIISELQSRRGVWMSVGAVVFSTTIAVVMASSSSDSTLADADADVVSKEVQTSVASPRPQSDPDVKLEPVVGSRSHSLAAEVGSPSKVEAPKEAAPLEEAPPADDGAKSDPDAKTGANIEQQDPKVDPTPQAEVESQGTPTKAIDEETENKSEDGVSRFIPSDTPEAHREALLKIPLDPDDRKPVGGIGLTGIHVDKLSFGREYVDHRCTGDTRTFSVTGRDRVNICIRMVHDAITETANINWELDGVVQRRNKVHLSRHRHFVGGYAVLKLAMESQWIGNWRVFVESSDGTVLAEVEFEVID